MGPLLNHPLPPLPITPPAADVEGANDAPATVSVVTNLYDLTWQYRLLAHDLVLLNPRSAGAPPGAVLQRPCYLPGRGLAPAYFGGSVSYLQFAGGNEVEGNAGLEGAMAAGGVFDHLPYQ